MPFLRYVPLSTFLHRLHPFSKFAILLSYIVVLSLFYEPMTVGVVGATVIVLAIVAKFDYLETVHSLIWPLLMLFLIMVVNSLWMYKPEMYVNMPKDLATTVILNLTPPETPILGRTAITIGGTIYAFAMTLRALVGILAFSLFVDVTSLSEILYGLGQVGIPRVGVFIFMAAYRLFPLFLSDIRTIVDAQTLRGWKVSSKNPFKIANQYMALMIPAFNRLTVVAENIGLSAESRAFGTRKFSTYRDVAIHQSDLLVMTFFITATVISIWLYVSFRIGML